MNLNFSQLNQISVKFKNLEKDEKIAWFGLFLGILLVIIALMLM